MTKRIPVAGPWITQREIDYVADATANAWYANSSAYNLRFEEAFAQYVGRRYAVSLPSCTSAIHLALLALGVGPGDEVVVPEITWIASAAPISYVGAKPVFADVEQDTWCLSADSLEASITPRTKAVIPVDLYGGMPDMDAVLAVANRHRIAVIEDSAEAIGSEYKGRRAGAFGSVSVFSFHGSKTLTTGEGGMLVTDDRSLLERVQVLRDHGRHPGDHSFLNREVAYKYKMSGIQAALGLAQLERIDELVARKRSIFQRYKQRLEDLPGIELNFEPAHMKNSYWMVTAVFPESWGGKQSIIASLGRDGIDSRPFFSPLSSLPAYADLTQSREAMTSHPVSYHLGPNGVNLPSALTLSDADVDQVSSALHRLRPK